MTLRHGRIYHRSLDRRFFISHSTVRDGEEVHRHKRYQSKSAPLHQTFRRKSEGEREERESDEGKMKREDVENEVATPSPPWFGLSAELSATSMYILRKEVFPFAFRGWDSPLSSASTTRAVVACMEERKYKVK